MWGNILTEIIVQTNFNTNFSNNHSDVLLHLSQWQYWWWFWFTFIWAFYYLTILKVLRFRTLKFRPRIATTMRPHGKWGDLLICIIPVSWCGNILSNSNFILRMIEWQAESSLFTVRIRGKQWYWVYKFELKTFTDVLSAPKNVGRDNWSIFTPAGVEVANDFLKINQLRSQNKWIKKYWNKNILENEKVDLFHLTSSKELLKWKFKKNFQENELNKNFKNLNLFFDLNPVDIKNIFTFKSNKNLLLHDCSFINYSVRLNNKRISWNSINPKVYDSELTHPLKNLKKNFFSSDFFNYSRSQQINTTRTALEFFKNPLVKSSKTSDNIFYKYNDVETTTRWLKRSYGNNNPVRLLKIPVLENNTNVFDIRFYKPESVLNHKPAPHSTFLSFSQKRYARKKIILPRKILKKNELGVKIKNKIKFEKNQILINNSFITNNIIEPNTEYRFFRKNKIRSENTSVLLSRRLLRTRRTLVLPAHVNLTAITNSYDVIHSWFIPGLGLKMDCIPGRSTHHTFYIDNAGFYYGQCAEICGRYHHHMPIRICALPFEHFLLWWHTYGLPKLLSTKPKKRLQRYYSSRKYTW